MDEHKIFHISHAHLFSVDVATCLPDALPFPLTLPLLVLLFGAYDTGQ